VGTSHWQALRDQDAQQQKHRIEWHLKVLLTMNRKTTSSISKQFPERIATIPR
jgi:hypothetical protein